MDVVGVKVEEGVDVGVTVAEAAGVGVIES